MHYQARIAPQREAAFLERRRPHHALRVIAESRRLLGNAESARVQRPVSVQVLEKGQGIRPLGQALARHDDGLVLHLHAEAREEFLQESGRCRVLQGSGIGPAPVPRFPSGGGRRRESLL